MTTKTSLFLTASGILAALLLVPRVLDGRRGNESVGRTPDFQDFSHAAVPQARLMRALDRIPLYFVENRGQLDSQVSYSVRTRDTAIYFTSDGITIGLTSVERPQPAIQKASLRRPEEPTTRMRQWAVKLDFVNANPKPEIAGRERTSAAVSYFRGPRKDWRSGLRTYASIVYRDLWPGIDLAYSGAGSSLKYMFRVAPGADPKKIRMAYRGIETIRLDETGGLSLTTPLGRLNDSSPVSYQQVGDKRVPVESRYLLDEETRGFGFAIGSYDPRYHLVIDPGLVYSTFLGGTAFDQGQGIAVDSAGNAYVTGVTASANFPVTAGAYDTTFNSGAFDVFVTKLDPAGSSLVYSTYLGGSASDQGWSIAVDFAGNAYVTGSTASADFPVTGGVFDPTFNGAFDAFVVKLNATGTALAYSTFLGGSLHDESFGIAVDSGGNAYATGQTTSPDYATVGGSFDTTHNGSTDAFVTKLNAAGSALIYSTFLGGTFTDFGRSVVVDGAGRASVTGNASSSDFPVTAGAWDTTFNGVFDAFVARLDTTGSALDYSTFVGGTTVDLGDGIGIDAAGSAYVGGRTDSVNFPTTAGAWDQTFNGVRDAWVAKLDPSGSSLVYSTYIGGTDDDIGNDVAVDASGSAVVTGQTASVDFATTPGAHDTSYNLGYDAFLTRLDVSGSTLLYSTYLGGTAEDGGSDVAFDEARSAYITGSTFSPDYPTTAGAYDTTFNGSSDAIVAKLDTTAPGEGESTPGKVTGGGSILADGSLAPATVLIGQGINASLGDTATFGFVVQFDAGDPSPTGNLTYNDHGADVRIKAVSFSLLSIGVGPCGLDTHAKFRGSAEVTGPGMPSLQDFEVDVDDCGEPGSSPGVGPDTFMIRTSVGTTVHYLAVGPLVGGNIQVRRD